MCFKTICVAHSIERFLRTSSRAAPQVTYISKKYHVYMLQNGRANMCGLTVPTVPYFAAAIDDAVRNVQGKL